MKIDFANLQNQHDDEPEEMAEALNSIINQKEVIETIYQQLKEKIVEL